MFIRLFTKICKEKETYNIVDTFILGICFATILLSASSLLLPSNHYILLAYIITGIIYWACSTKRLISYISHLKNILASLSLLQKSLIGITILSVLLYMLFTAIFFDAGYYHYQQIRWNEEYSVVPGLANFEDRYGFNSNYLLLSAIFTLRFMFGEPVYMLQSLLFVLLLCWAMVNFFRSGYNIHYLIILLLLFFTLLWGGYMLADTSTDIIPLLCIFYYLVKTALKPQWLSQQYLMAFLLPVTMITFKVSTAFFCLISLGILIYLIKQRRGRVIYFLLTISAVTVLLWLVRNVIISGYLVYPMYNIDLFSFDWKVPEGTAALQKLHIYNWAQFIFDVEYIYRTFKMGLSGNWLEFFNSAFTLALFAFVLISPVIVIYTILKKGRLCKRIYYLYVISLICIVFGMVSAPDFRFINGYIFGCVVILSIIISPSGKKLAKTGKWAGIALTCCLLLFVAQRGRTTAFNYKIKPNKENIKSLLIRPQHPVYDLRTKEYTMGDFSIYLKVGDEPRNFGMIPVANEKGIPFEQFTGDKIQSIHTIEARGDKIQDGFRTKKEYIDIINKNTSQYIEEYKKAQKIKYPQGYFE